MRTVVLALVFCAIAFISANADQPSHPAKGHRPLPVHGYGYANKEWEHADITITTEKERPPFDTLTDEELYILAGTADSSLPDKGSLIDWRTQIFGLLADIYSATGSLPDRLDPEIIKQTSGYSALPEAYLDLYRNPLTGQWPSLKESKLSPGNLYVRPLTLEEMKDIASKQPAYRKLWFEHRKLDAENYDPNLSYLDQFTISADLVSPVLYMRFYGWKGVISDGFMFRMQDR